MKLSIIIPIFNEDRTIEKILKLVKGIKLPKNLKKEIVVVDDASSDKTPQILKEFGETIKIIRHNRNLGKGAAVRTGIQNATGDIFIIQDADLEYDPKDYLKLL